MARRAAPAATVEYFGTSPSRHPSDRTKWQYADEHDVYSKVFATVRAIESQQGWRTTQRLKHVRMYGNREIAGLSASKYAQTVTRKREDRLTLNVCKSCVDTAAAKISKNKPRPLFLTSGADAKKQDRAKSLTKFVAGLFDAAKVYATGQLAFRDSCVVDTGVVKVTDDGDDIRADRVFVDELFVDEVEAQYGEPQQLHQRREFQLSKLLAMFPDEAKQEAIRAAVRRDGSESDHVEVIESWYLRSSKKSKDGKHAMSIGGATLLFEEYEYDYFPFVFLYWTPPFRGFWGQGLVEEIVGIQIDINKTLRTIQEAQNLACVPRVFFDSATAGTLKPIDNEIGGHYSFSGRPPVISTASAMPAEIYQHLENMFHKAFEVTGISQMSATGKKPAGLDAAVALREYQDIETERFVLVGQRYEDFYMQIARIMIDLMRSRAEARKPADGEEPASTPANDNALRVKVRDGKHVEMIDWSEVDLHEDEYEMQVFPVSFLPSSPAGRLQTVKELVKDGFIADRAQAMALLDFPDLEAFQNLQTAALTNIRSKVDAILERGEFSPPDKYLNVALAREIAQSAYERGEEQGRPRAHLDLLDTWMQQLDELEDAMKPPPAPPTGPAQMVPMGEGTAPPLVPQEAAPNFAA